MPWFDEEQLQSCNACYRSAQILLPSPLSKSVKISVGLYGCETWSLILKEENMLTVFENRVLKGTSEVKRDEIIVADKIV
jgi:hypothetical protein